MTVPISQSIPQNAIIFSMVILHLLGMEAV